MRASFLVSTSSRDRPAPRVALSARFFAALLVTSGCAALLPSGCTALVPEPTPRDVAWAQQKWPASAVQELHQGRELYVRKCAGCHHLIAPERFSPDRWIEEVHEMAERARLSEPETELVLRYLVTMARGG